MAPRLYSGVPLLRQSSWRPGKEGTLPKIGLQKQRFSFTVENMPCRILPLLQSEEDKICQTEMKTLGQPTQPVSRSCLKKPGDELSSVSPGAFLTRKQVPFPQSRANPMTPNVKPSSGRVVTSSMLEQVAS